MIRLNCAIFGIAVLVAAAGCSSAPPVAEVNGPPPPRQATEQDQLAADRQWLAQVGPAMVGRHFGCAQVVPRAGRLRDATGLHLYVVHPDALPAAQRLKRRLRSATRVEVRVISPRYSAAEMRRIRREIEDDLPGGEWQSFGVALSRRSPCPVVRVAVLPPSRSSEDTERWLEETRARYGADRVWFVRSHGNTPG